MRLITIKKVNTVIPVYDPYSLVIENALVLLLCLSSYDFEEWIIKYQLQEIKQILINKYKMKNLSLNQQRLKKLKSDPLLLSKPSIKRRLLNAIQTPPWPDLPGAEEDQKRLINLFKDKFGYEVISNTKPFINENDFYQYLDKARQEIEKYRNPNNICSNTKYDTFIFAFAGHAIEDKKLF